MTKNILVYTAPGCPDCAAMKKWLERHGIAYDELDITKPGIADEAKNRYGVRVAPITVIGDKFFYGTFKDQIPDVKKALDIVR